MSVDFIHTQQSGVPAGTPPAGSLAVDPTTGIIYTRTDGGTWAVQSGASPAEAFTSVPFQGGSVVPVDDSGIGRLAPSGLLADGVVTTTAGSTSIVHPATGSIYTLISPGASAFDQGHFSSPSTIHGPEILSECFIKFFFENADRSRLWIGYGGATAAALNTNSPAGAAAMLRFANADTNFQFVSQGAGTTVTDTGIVPVNGTTYYLKVTLTLSSATYTLFDSSLAVLDTHEETTNHPNSGSIMRFHIYTENESVAVARNIGVYFAHVQNKAI